MRKMTSKEFWDVLAKYENYFITNEKTRKELIKLIVDKESLFKEKPDYIVAYMEGEYNDAGGTDNVLSECAVFEEDGTEIKHDTLEKSDRFYELEDIVRDLVNGSPHNEVVIPLKKDFMPLELYVDDKNDSK